MSTQNIKQHFKFALTIILTALLMSGCSNDMSDLETWVSDEKAKRVPFRNDMPDPEPYEAFNYSASDLRSPFVPNKRIEAKPETNNGIRPIANRNKEQLENYPLDTLRMVGSLNRNNQTTALVQSTDGLIHRVVAGNYVGQNEGRIIAITDSEIELIEIVPNNSGGYREEPAAIGLSD